MWLTPSERRGALILVSILFLGTGWDLWLASPAAHRAGRARPFAAADSVRPDNPRGPSGLPDSSGARLDLNRATAFALDALPGIGPVLASRIVARRASAGPYRRPEDLLSVPGIGPRLFARLQSRIAVAPLPAGSDSMHSAKPGGGRRADSPSAKSPAFR